MVGLYLLTMLVTLKIIVLIQNNGSAPMSANPSLNQTPHSISHRYDVDL